MNNFSLKELTKILSTVDAVHVTDKFAYSKLYTTLSLIAVDMFSVFACFFFAIIIQNFISDVNANFTSSLTTIILLLPLFPLCYSFAGLYPGYGINQVNEFKRLTAGTTIMYLFVTLVMLVMYDLSVYPSFAFILSCFLTVCIVPLSRSLLRKVLSKYDWWGIPVIVIGAGNAGCKVISTLHNQIYTGLRPVVAVDDDVDKWGYIENVPVIGGLQIIPELSRKLAIDHAIIALPNTPSEMQNDIIKENSRYFSHLTVIPEVFGNANIWVTTNDIGGVLGFDVQRRLLHKSAQMQKRAFDIILASILLIITAPLQLLIALAIKLDSPGKVFFKQKRMGLHGSSFDIIKFRSMYSDAEEKLSKILKANAKLKKEFQLFHKLDDDPRVTRIGKIIRKFSLDELPQFINVIKGDMSLIGPRAYCAWEKPNMIGCDTFILQIKPGISGLWQVTDRSSSFEDRVRMDVYYLGNWSFFTDVVLVGKTIIAILRGTGS